MSGEKTVLTPDEVVAFLAQEVLRPDCHEGAYPVQLYANKWDDGRVRLTVSTGLKVGTQERQFIHIEGTRETIIPTLCKAMYHLREMLGKTAGR
jgi:hypothetical protein